mgnify:FL=1
MKEIFKCAMIIVGTLIGAGFASGQEIATFFNRFLDYGMWGLILACVLFGIIIFGVLSLVSKKNILTYDELIKDNKFFMPIIKLFTFICFCIMISAIGSYGEEQFGVSFWIGAILSGILCFILFLFKFSGLEKINNILVPFILIGTLILGIAKYDLTDLELMSGTENYSPFMNTFLTSSILYAGYNSILLVPILVELKKYNLKRRDIILLSILVTLILSVSGILIYRAISVFYPNILFAELPTLILAKMCGDFAWKYYSIVILFAIITTAFSCGYAFLKMNSEKNYFRNAALMCFAGVLLSRIGFSQMINICFPLFGYLGIAQLIMIFLPKKNKEE